MTAKFFPLTGQVRLANSNAAPVDFIFYSITSNAGALNGANGVWKSIADTYDASGNGFIDPIDQWVEISTASDELAEGLFTPGTLSTFPAFRSISLGKIWDPDLPANPANDLDVEVVLADGESPLVAADFAIDGDYNGDDVVNAFDYSIWKMWFGSTSALFADGNLNGIVDAADYTVWRDNLGKSLLGTGFSSAMVPGFGAAAVTVVPEPSAAILLLGSLLGSAAFARRARVSPCSRY